MKSKQQLAKHPCPVRRAAYRYMSDNKMTLTYLGQVLGFASRQATHHWLHKGVRMTQREAEIKAKLIELGVDL